MAKTLKSAAASKKQTAKVPAVRRSAGQRDRLSCRIDHNIKQRAEEAAMLLGQDLTAFTETALDEKAQAVIDRAERLTLSDQDFERFVEAIDNPAPPTPALVAARRSLRQFREEHPQGNW